MKQFSFALFLLFVGSVGTAKADRCDVDTSNPRPLRSAKDVLDFAEELAIARVISWDCKGYAWPSDMVVNRDHRVLRITLFRYQESKDAIQSDRYWGQIAYLRAAYADPVKRQELPPELQRKAKYVSETSDLELARHLNRESAVAQEAFEKRVFAAYDQVVANERNLRR